MEQSNVHRPTTMPSAQARRLADEANALPYDPDRATRLAWRPAWSIRSRRGAWAAFLDMFRRGPSKD